MKEVKKMLKKIEERINQHMNFEEVLSRTIINRGDPWPVVKEKTEKLRKWIGKPCIQLGYCPYGSLVETFPLTGESDELSCSTFGHACPVLKVSEPFVD